MTGSFLKKGPAEERGKDAGVGGKPRTGSALRETKEAEGLNMERQEDARMTGKNTPQEKEDPGLKSGHLKESRARGEPRLGRTR